MPEPMNFTTVGLVPDACSCLDFNDANRLQFYARRIKRPEVDAANFCTHYERDPSIKLAALANCAKWCSSTTALSINEWNPQEKENIIRKYLQNFDKSKTPRKDAILIFTLPIHLGKIKPTPKHSDPSHHDLYKSDNFDIAAIEIIEVIRLEDYRHLLTNPK